MVGVDLVDEGLSVAQVEVAVAIVCDEEEPVFPASLQAGIGLVADDFVHNGGGFADVEYGDAADADVEGGIACAAFFPVAFVVFEEAEVVI